MKSVRLFGREVNVYKLIGALTIFSIVAAAATYTLTKTITLQAKEPLSIAVTPEGTVNLYPGETKDVVIEVNNSAPVSYGLTVNKTGDCEIVSITADGTVISEHSTNTNYDSTDTFNIVGTSDPETPVSGTITYTIKLDESAGAGETCTFTVDSVERGEPFGE